MSSLFAIPDKEHWAVITGGSTYVAADQRSIDHPGHGYPAHSVEHIDYRAFYTKESLEEYLSKRAYGVASNTKVVHVTPLTVEIKTCVKAK